MVLPKKVYPSLFDDKIACFFSKDLMIRFLKKKIELNK